MNATGSGNSIVVNVLSLMLLMFVKMNRSRFHSHPSLSPISKNPSGNPKFRVAGDIGHSYYGKKNIFAINSDGDIFYTNPQLAGSCIDFNDCAESYYGQVYLGNIKEFMK